MTLLFCCERFRDVWYISWLEIQEHPSKPPVASLAIHFKLSSSTVLLAFLLLLTLLTSWATCPAQSHGSLQLLVLPSLPSSLFHSVDGFPQQKGVGWGLYTYIPGKKHQVVGDCTWATWLSSHTNNWKITSPRRLKRQLHELFINAPRHAKRTHKVTHHLAISNQLPWNGSRINKSVWIFHTSRKWLQRLGECQSIFELTPTHKNAQK